MKNILVIVIGLLSSTQSLAEWRTDYTRHITATKQEDIVTALEAVPSTALRRLSALNLVRSAKVVVTYADVTLSWKRWVNDNGCELPDKSPLKELVVESSFVYYYFSNSPNDIQSFGFTGGVPATPCQNSF